MDVARIQILVVDDLVDAADTTVELLSAWGYDAVACYTGVAALESACLRRPDVVLLDLAMPKMDGFEFAGLFHELPDCGSVPLIALTGHSSQIYRARAWGGWDPPLSAETRRPRVFERPVGVRDRSHGDSLVTQRGQH
jgi:CheY-like chemotaxis protein